MATIVHSDAVAAHHKLQDRPYLTQADAMQGERGRCPACTKENLIHCHFTAFAGAQQKNETGTVWAKHRLQHASHVLGGSWLQTHHTQLIWHQKRHLCKSQSTMLRTCCVNCTTAKLVVNMLNGWERGPPPTINTPPKLAPQADCVHCSPK